MNEKVSIIVPVYNVEDYLEKCIVSLINQTFKNIEILLIDDGSTDNSGTICDKYKELDNRIKVFHKKNGGLANVRNYGIAHANGEYIAFVDSDDYVDHDYIECFISGVTKYNSKITLMGHIYEKEHEWIIRQISETEKVLTIEDAMTELLLDKRLNSYMWQGMFHKSVFTDIVFPDGENYEDFRTMPDIFANAGAVTLLPVEKYHYIQRMTSISNSTKKIGQNSFSLFLGHMKRTEITKKWALNGIMSEMEAKEIISGVCFIVNVLKGLFQTTEYQYTVVETRLLDSYGIKYKNDRLSNEYKIKLKAIILLHSGIKLYSMIKGNIEK